MYKDLGFKDKLKGKSGIKVAILSSMVFEVEVLLPLVEEKVPMTVFLERDKDVRKPFIEHE